MREIIGHDEIIKTTVVCLVGMQHHLPKDQIEDYDSGMGVSLRPEPNNQHDANAIAVYKDNVKLGYISREDTWVGQHRLLGGLILGHPTARYPWCDVEVRYAIEKPVYAITQKQRAAAIKAVREALLESLNPSPTSA